MPKLSPTSGTVQDFGVVAERAEELDGYTAAFVDVRETQDMTAMLAGLPGGHCSCPHWGYVIKGRWIVKYADREETYDAGDAFYMSPGHVPTSIEAGTETVMFSPADELKATDAAIVAYMQARAAAQ